MIAGVTTVLDNSNREVKCLQQKFEILQTQQDLMRDLSDPGICACNFDPTKNVTNAATLSFDTTNPDSMMSSPNLFATCIGGVPGSPLITIGQPLPGSQAGLKVKTIQMKEFVATGTGRYRARIEVAFDANSLKIARKPASVNVSVVADVSNPAQAKITSCTAGKDIGASGGSSLADVKLAMGLTANWPSYVYCGSPTKELLELRAVHYNAGYGTTWAIYGGTSFGGAAFLPAYHISSGAQFVVSGSGPMLPGCPNQLALDGREVQFP